ncbi:TlyA family RNA methyltransferase [Agaribacterium sp. ZY112]|uniref:TlyA family RNA methyltransferase n=1 Tax=Agaribacterium sp. ZY112 TaxID=3233574 RepID=UPI003526742E
MERADKLLVQSGLAASRTLAQRLIEAGKVEVERSGQWQSLEKSNTKLDSSSNFRVQDADELRYVSRAGLKLEGALKTLDKLGLELDLSQCSVLDVGQSTGGFTDCLLKHGCRSVCGVDVGHGQLHKSLLEDTRVRCLERVNARTLSQTFVHERFDLSVMDVSFISQTLILPELAQLLTGPSLLISLVKPQFEVGPEGIAKGGLVKDRALYQVVEEKIRTLLQELGFKVLSWKESAIKGGDGNREFVVIAQHLS